MKKVSEKNNFPIFLFRRVLINVPDLKAWIFDVLPGVCELVISWVMKIHPESILITLSTILRASGSIEENQIIKNLGE